MSPGTQMQLYQAGLSDATRLHRRPRAVTAWLPLLMSRWWMSAPATVGREEASHAQLAQWGILMGDRGPHSESCQRQRTPDTGPDEKKDRVPASSDASEGGRWPQQVAREPPRLCQQPWGEGVE